MSVGGWRATKGKTDGRGITPAEAISIEQGGFILNKVSNQIKQEPHKNNTNISYVIWLSHISFSYLASNRS